jgi:LytR cell envelope-related transcriptional attenuator
VDSSLASSIELPAQSGRRSIFLIAILGVFAAAAVAGVLVAEPFGGKAATSRALGATPVLQGKIGPDTPAGAATRTHAQIVVMVLNGNGKTGAAAAAAANLRQVGYRIGMVGNSARSDYPKSVIMYTRGFRPEAIRLGRELGVRLVGPLDGMRRSDTGRAGIVYVLGLR